MVARHPNVAFVARCYAALGRRDATTLIASCGDGAMFSDPVPGHR